MRSNGAAHPMGDGDGHQRHRHRPDEGRPRDAEVAEHAEPAEPSGRAAAGGEHDDGHAERGTARWCRARTGRRAGCGTASASACRTTERGAGEHRGPGARQADLAHHYQRPPPGVVGIDERSDDGDGREAHRAERQRRDHRDHQRRTKPPQHPRAPPTHRHPLGVSRFPQAEIERARSISRPRIGGGAERMGDQRHVSRRGGG